MNEKTPRIGTKVSIQGVFLLLYEKNSLQIRVIKREDAIAFPQGLP